MNSVSTHHTFFLVPVSREAGLTSMALGLVRSLQLAGVKVGFVKPIVQPEAIVGDTDLAGHFARTLCGTETPEPLHFDHAAEMVRAGQIAALMEEVVALTAEVRAEHDVVVVEGLIPDADLQIVTRLNIEMIRTLGADLIPVLAGGDRDIDALSAKTATAIEQYGDDGRRPVAGVLVNLCSQQTAQALTMQRTLRAAGIDVPVLAAVPTEPRLAAPRVLDVAEALGFEVLHRGEIETARVQTLLVAARSPEKLIGHLRPGTLVVTPADRSDAILATALVAQRGMPLAGFVFTCGGRPAPEIGALLRSAPLDRLPVLGTDDDTFTTATRLAGLSRHVGRGDIERMERVVGFVAEKIAVPPLVSRLHVPVEPLMPPPVFRHRLVEAARAANRRIVLPEGDEPRTLKAAAICAEKGIARCVLLGKPEDIRSVAAAHGIDLPEGVEILDPEITRGAYVGPMVELRKAKGLTAVQAEKGLEDTVVLGTMMLAVGDVDGLVSGAVHTTANTVRPALQLIKTAPGSSIVSSVFFMLMPDQVLV
jgi:phosphate acetyltransferase